MKENDGSPDKDDKKFNNTQSMHRGTTMLRMIRKGNCKHHWIIEPPNAHISIGRCKLCNACEEFINDWETAFKIIQSPHHTSYVRRNANRTDSLILYVKKRQSIFNL